MESDYDLASVIELFRSLTEQDILAMAARLQSEAAHG